MKKPPKSEKELDQEFSRLIRSISEDRSNAIDVFHQICIYVVDNYQSAQMDMMQACYTIAGALNGIPEISYDDEANDVFDYAFDLELPDAHLADDRDKQWKEMNEIIDTWRDKK